jgi:hypothetical protein
MYKRKGANVKMHYELGNDPMECVSNTKKKMKVDHKITNIKLV